MINAAEMMQRKHLYTVEDYYRMAESGILKPGERVELIEGVIVDMLPIGSAHGGVVNKINHLLSQVVGDGAVVAVQNPVRLNDLSEPEPDVALLRSRHDFYTESHPCPDDVRLIIEVADSSLSYDRDVKLPLYARHGIPQLWLVDLAAKELWIYSQPQGECYKEKVKADLQQPVSLPGLSGVQVDLSTLF